MIETGLPAPDFTLSDQDGEPVRLADLRGSWVVLYFYPKDDTPGCTIQACDFTADLDAFESLDAVVLGCSPDSPESHRAFIAKHDLAIRLLSDPGHETIARYGAWGEVNWDGRPREGVLRSTVLIDPDGRVARHWPRVVPRGHAEEVRARIAALRAG